MAPNTGHPNSAVQLLLNVGNGHFESPTAFAVGPFQHGGMAAEDVTGDGKQDVIVTPGNNTISVVVSQGNTLRAACAADTSPGRIRARRYQRRWLHRHRSHQYQQLLHAGAGLVVDGRLG